MINSSQMDTNLTMPTFGIDPMDFREFVKALYGL